MRLGLFPAHAMQEAATTATGVPGLIRYGGAMSLELTECSCGAFSFALLGRQGIYEIGPLLETARAVFQMVVFAASEKQVLHRDGQ
jgi:hypothetical protein